MTEQSALTLDPVTTALLVVDMHKGSLEPPGTVFVPGGQSLLEPLRTLLDTVRQHGARVVYLVHQVDVERGEARNPFWLESAGLARLYPNVRQQTPGSHWAEVPDAIAPQAGDVVLPKKRYGAFTGNGLFDLLRMWNVSTVLLAGVLTEICVLASAFDAFNHDYRVVVARDCVKGLEPDCEAAALRIIERELGWVVSADDVARAISASTPPQAPRVAATAR